MDSHSNLKDSYKEPQEQAQGFPVIKNINLADLNGGRDAGDKLWKMAIIINGIKVGPNELLTIDRPFSTTSAANISNTDAMTHTSDLREVARNYPEIIKNVKFKDFGWNEGSGDKIWTTWLSVQFLELSSNGYSTVIFHQQSHTKRVAWQNLAAQMLMLFSLRMKKAKKEQIKDPRPVKKTSSTKLDVKPRPKAPLLKHIRELYQEAYSDCPIIKDVNFKMLGELGNKVWGMSLSVAIRVDAYDNNVVAEDDNELSTGEYETIELFDCGKLGSDIRGRLARDMMECIQWQKEDLENERKERDATEETRESNSRFTGGDRVAQLQKAVRDMKTALSKSVTSLATINTLQDMLEIVEGN